MRTDIFIILFIRFCSVFIDWAPGAGNMKHKKMTSFLRDSLLILHVDKYKAVLFSTFVSEGIFHNFFVRGYFFLTANADRRAVSFTLAE